MALSLGLAQPASAQRQMDGPAPGRNIAQEQLLKEVRLDQRLNNQLPLDTRFKDETGKDVQLHQYFGKKPVMLMLIQLRCTMLCTEQVNILLDSLKALQFTPGKQFELLVVSIDPREDPQLAAETREHYLGQYGRPEGGAGWHVLTGTKENIDRLSNALGFHYAYDARTDQYAHPDGVMIATPEGKVARYYFKLNYDPRDLRLGLVEAARHKIGNPLDALALLCYHYSPMDGKYSLRIMSVVKVSAIATVVVMALGIGLMSLKNRVRRPQAGQLAAHG